VDAGIHGLGVIIDKCLFGGRRRRIIEVESSKPEGRLRRAT